MKKLFCWALAVVVLNVLVHQMCVAIWGHDVAVAVALAAFVAFATVATTVAVVVAFAKEENLPYWRVMVVVLGEAGAILGWMLLWPHSLPLAAGTLLAGVGVMALAAFAGVPEPENKTAAVEQ
ncbi:MAG: hypothetical protein WAP55_02015 [Minisyncoccia bacterium]